MSPRRWAGTTALMAAIAWALASAAPGWAEASATLSAPQAAVDAGGPDALLVVLAAGLGWLVWAWGAAGLLLTALSALPGVPGRLAGLVAAAVLPESGRRAAALALGLSLGATAPIAGIGLRDGSAVPATAVVTASAATALPDWPAAVPGAPDWRAAPEAGEHVVVAGDCLWDVVRDRLTAASPGSPVPDVQIAVAVHAWWQANADVIGPDPDVVRPGQVLHPPTA